MPKASPEYRADHLACPLNPGKLGQVRELVRELRKTATREASLQWRQFYQGLWQGFESMAKKGWTRPWIRDSTLNTTFSQLVMSQVSASLKGYFGNVQNTYTELVSGSSLPANLRHQLHFINRQQAWFWKCDVKVRQQVATTSKNGTITTRLADVIVEPDVRAYARTIIRRALATHQKPHFENFQPQLDQRVCFVQASHTARHPYWLRISTLANQKKIDLPLEIHEAFQERNNQSGLYQALAKSPVLQAPPVGDGQGFLKHMQAMEEQLRPTQRNPHPSGFAIPNTVRLLLSEDQQSLTVGVVSDMGPVFEHQAATYQPLHEAIYLDMGLATLLATSDGELHGRNWMEVLLKFDKLITGIARHRSRLGLKVASKRYRTHVQRLRGWLKTEIHRILNRLVERKRPGSIVLEALDFRSPQMSRRMNRLIQNFGQSVLKAKLAEIEKQYGIAVEYRDAAYTSQECSSCHYVAKNNRPSQAVFECKFCQHRCHADIQAARVLSSRRSGCASGSSTKIGRQHTLTELVRQFNERFTRPRGGPADPRFTNPYYADWAKTWKDKLSEGCRGEVTSQLRRSEKKAA
jgi:putative transposase